MNLFFAKHHYSLTLIYASNPKPAKATAMRPVPTWRPAAALCVLLALAADPDALLVTDRLVAEEVAAATAVREAVVLVP